MNTLRTFLFSSACSIPALPSLCTSEISQLWWPIQGAGLGCGMFLLSESLQDWRTEHCLVLFHVPSPTLSAGTLPPSMALLLLQVRFLGLGGHRELGGALLSRAMECVCTPLLPTLPPALAKAHRKSVYPWGMTPEAFPDA